MKSAASTTDKLKNLGHIFMRRHTKEEPADFFIGIGIREIRATLILFVTICLFLAMWLPGIIAYVVFKHYPEKSSLLLIMIQVLMFQLNSMLNPFLFVRAIKDVKIMCKKWIKWTSYMKGSESNESNKSTET